MFCLDDSLFRHISKQITDLTLMSNENNSGITLKDYTMNIYLNILAFFENLNHLTIVSSPINNYPSLSLYDLPSTSFFSSILTKLRIYVLSFNDCLALLDGRLKQLTKFTVEDDLPNLKSFSLICYTNTSEYDNQVLRLLRRMSYLKELTLYLCIEKRPTFVDGTHLHNEILAHMPQLHTFNFYISMQNEINDSTIRLSNNDIQRTFTNARYGQVVCTVDYLDNFKIIRKVICKIFSLPFTFDRLERLSNNFPSILFNNVTHLMLWDTIEFEHEFFVRVARAFPLLKYLIVNNIRPPLWIFRKPPLDDYYSPIVEYPHLISLDLSFANSYYVDQFLNEKKTILPRLTKLNVPYNKLESVTENFTRNETRRNCAQVKHLIVDNASIVFSEDVYRYFRSL
ncbi:unnamed protein product [Rotaria sp. Silwood2]|nr:unnamed protein product [Rotaria sp. Silwood2]CAF3182224.1 unnamed protein product [Rotaria sp. Silwood2]CAF4334021.1 unnamed protein product [Rotaria sp. Silwood2]CAF4432539.1 unnamed protein product [Rotaria sp. Silwood2]